MEPAVDVDRGAVDVRGGVAGQEGDHAGDFLGGSVATDRHSRRVVRDDLLGSGSGVRSKRGRSAFPHRGHDQAGQDRVDEDAVAAVEPRQALGQRDHRDLARGVIDTCGVRHLGRQRRHHHDAPPAAFAHAAEHRPRRVDRANQVDVEELAPRLIAPALEVPLAGAADVVDQDVDRSELVADAPEKGVNLLGHRHVGGDPEDHCAGRRDLALEGRDRLCVASGKAHRGAVRSESPHGGAPDSRATARDHSHPPRQARVPARRCCHRVSLLRSIQSVVEAAIDVDCRAVDVRSSVAGQEGDHGGDFLGGSVATYRHVRRDVGDDLVGA